MDITQSVASSFHFEMLFESLLNRDRCLAFPCNEAGQVDIDALTEHGRMTYFFARAMRGREYAPPRVVPFQCCPRTSGVANRERPKRVAQVFEGPVIGMTSTVS